MLRTEKKASMTAAAMGGRTARVCDSCLCKRARWFCAADDAFLCQACDVSVHSANQLARRHDRIRLETASLKSRDQSQSHLPPWLKGFTRKARTPRPNKQISSTKDSVFSLVPEIGNDEGLLLMDENEDERHQFVNHHQQVPVFDPFDDQKLFLTDQLEDFGDGFLASEVDLAEFVADVESLLGRRPEEEQENESRLLKVKDEEQEELVQDCVNNNTHNNNEFFGGDILDWNFKGEEIEEDEENKAVVPLAVMEDEVKAFEEELKINNNNKNIFLRLNYDAVITAWDGQSSPYTTGNRPQFDLDDSWEEWVLNEKGDKLGGTWGRGEWKNDGEREARVSRYREKRRTRLFSKKIRYQVRKLNAEKRPRMKGRFVKRTTTPLLY